MGIVIIMNMFELVQKIFDEAKCEKSLKFCWNCKQNSTFVKNLIRGLGFKLFVKCNCGSRNLNSSPVINTVFEVNRRMEFVMPFLLVGRQGLNLFFSYMDIGSDIACQRYNRRFNYKFKSGTWKNGGSKSLFGVSTFIAYNCGKVFDIDVWRSYCQACKK